MKTSGMRDTAADPRPAFVVDDDDGYVSARWLGDTHLRKSVVGQAFLIDRRREIACTAVKFAEITTLHVISRKS